MISESIFTMDSSSIKFGAGATREVGFDMKEMGARRVILVTDPGLAGSEPVAITRGALEREGMVFQQPRRSFVERRSERVIPVVDVFPEMHGHRFVHPRRPVLDMHSHRAGKHHGPRLSR